MHSSPLPRRFLPAIGLALLIAWVPGPEGLWEGTFTSPHGEQPLAVELKPEGALWSGRGVAGTTDLRAGSELLDLQVAGDSLTFGLEITTSMGKAVMRFAGAVSGSEVAGTYDMNIESMAVPMRGRWRAERK